MSRPHEFNAAYMPFLAQRCVGPDSLPRAPAVRDSCVELPDRIPQRLPVKPPRVCRQQPAELCRNVACATRAAGKKFTAQMREGPLGPGTLCNSCGIRWRRDILRQEQELRDRELKSEAAGVRLVRILEPDAPHIPPVAVMSEDSDTEEESDAETLSLSHNSRRYHHNERGGGAGVSSAVASGTAEQFRSYRVRAGAGEQGAAAAGVSSSQESTEGVEQGAGSGAGAAASHSTTWQVHGRPHAYQQVDPYASVPPPGPLTALHRQGLVKLEPSDPSGLKASTPAGSAAGNITLGLHHTSPHVTLAGLPGAMGLSPLAVMAASTHPQLVQAGAWPNLAAAVSLLSPAAQQVVVQQQVQLQQQLQLHQHVAAQQQLQHLQQQQLLLHLQQPASVLSHLATPQQLITFPLDPSQALLHPGVAVQLPSALHAVQPAVPSLLSAPMLLPTGAPQPYLMPLALAGQQVVLQPQAQLPK